MTTTQDERDRVRGYLRAQGEKYDFTGLWSRAVSARLQLLDALADVDDVQARFRAAADQWSIAEIAQHILSASTANRRIVEALAAGGAAGAERVDPPPEPTDRTIGDLRRALIEDAVEWASLTRRLPEPPSFDAVAPHPFFGELHARAWYLFQRVHDSDHAGQIAQVRGADGYPAG